MKVERAAAAAVPLSLILAIAIFSLDILSPLGVAEWVAYLLPTLFASRSKHRYYPYLFAVVCTELILLGYVYSPQAATADSAFISRCLGVTMLWITTVFLVQHRRSEEALKAREDFFRLISDSMTDMVAVVNRDAIRLYNSPSYERVLGNPKDLMGTNSFDEIHPDDRQKISEVFKATLQSGVGQRVEYRFLLKNGKIRYIESQGSVILDDDGKPDRVVVVQRDITERINMETQLRQSQKMEAVGQLAGGVAHDFNNLLTVIHGYTERLLAKKNLDADTVESLNRIYATAERAASLTRQLLGFSRQQAMHLQALNINDVIDNLGHMLRRIVGEDIVIRLPTAKEILAVKADAGMVEQVILNLVVNARDAMPKGGELTVTTSVVHADDAFVKQHTLGRVGEFVCMKVSDSGCGMDTATIARIFEPFFTTKEVGKGTGLGLATVYAIVNQHKGWVEVTSEVGKGTTFLVYFPRSEEAVEKLADATAKTKVAGGSATILLVEDEPLLRELACLIIQDYGYEVLSAANGVEALKLWALHRERIALLLTDVVMPGGISGRELAEKLKAERPDLKVIYTSGYSSDVVSKTLKDQGQFHFLQKPFQGHTLARILRECLES